MSVGPDELKELATAMRPELIGGLGAGMGYSYSVAEREKILRLAVMALVILFGMVGGWMVDEMCAERDVQVPAAVLWIVGFFMYPMVGPLRAPIMRWMERRARRVLDDDRPLTRGRCIDGIDEHGNPCSGERD